MNGDFTKSHKAVFVESRSGHRPRARYADTVPHGKNRFMLAQYVFPAKAGLFRIVRHGRRWRSMFDMEETGRHDSAEQALSALREAWPQARLPASLEEWRYLRQVAAMTHGRDPDEPGERWRMTG